MYTNWPNSYPSYLKRWFWICIWWKAARLKNIKTICNFLPCMQKPPIVLRNSVHKNMNIKTKYILEKEQINVYLWQKVHEGVFSCQLFFCKPMWRWAQIKAATERKLKMDLLYFCICMQDIIAECLIIDGMRQGRMTFSSMDCKFFC